MWAPGGAQWCWGPVSMYPRDSRLECRDHAGSVSWIPCYRVQFILTSEFHLGEFSVKPPAPACLGFQNRRGSHTQGRQGTVAPPDTEQPGHGPPTCFSVAAVMLPTLVVLAWEWWGIFDCSFSVSLILYSFLTAKCFLKPFANQAGMTPLVNVPSDFCSGANSFPAFPDPLKVLRW